MILHFLTFCVAVQSLPIEVDGSLSLAATADGPGVTQGWTSSPNNRGTIDIMWSCFITIFLCTWTAICVNVPPLGSGRRKQFERKLLVFLEALAGPEFIFHTALGQYISARRSVKDFEASGFQGWTLKHGFFADMGGFFLDPPDFVPFPLNVNQVHYLVSHGYIDYTAVYLSPSEINDKNKSDGMSRLITAAQLSWFVINILARAIQGLAITTLEITTIGFIFCSLSIYIAWRDKPQDVTNPVRLIPKVSMAEILVQAGPAAAKPYTYTPMDFAGRKPHWFGTMWAWTFRITEPIGIYFHPPKRPIDKVWDDEFGELGARGNLLLMFVQFGFAGIHLAAWNFHFPTRVETILWHISTVFVISSMVVTWVILPYAYELHPKLIEHWKSSRSKGVSDSSGSRSKKPPSPAMLTIPLGMLYIAARGYILVEDVVNLRSLPVSAYSSIDWNTFIPHLS